MKETYTFFLGAGSSCKTLPIGDALPKRLGEFGNYILRGEYALEPTPISWPFFPKEGNNTSREEARQLLSKRSIYFGNEAEKHASIDTLAKRYFINVDKSSLRELKAVLTCFFIWHQNFPERHSISDNYHVFDRRYDSFFASILESKNSFPGHIKIVTWNYDLQFELAYRNYSSTAHISENQQILRVANPLIKESFSPNITRMPPDDDFYLSNFGIFKLNGSAFIGGDIARYEDIFKHTSDSVELVKQLTEIYIALTSDSSIYSEISFAWEEIRYQNKVREIAQKVIQNSNYIIIIGYSFPFFNRKIDLELFKENRAKKIYVQDPNASKYLDKIAAITGRDKGAIEPVERDDRQFYFPHEM